MSTLANSENLDEMPHNVVFIQGLYIVQIKCNYTPILVAAELPLILVYLFTCFKSYVLFV